MHTPFDFNETGKRIVYVKAVDVADLPADVQAGAQGRKCPSSGILGQMAA